MRLHDGVIGGAADSCLNYTARLGAGAVPCADLWHCSNMDWSTPADDGTIGDLPVEGGRTFRVVQIRCAYGEGVVTLQVVGGPSTTEVRGRLTEYGIVPHQDQGSLYGDALAPMLDGHLSAQVVHTFLAAGTKAPHDVSAGPAPERRYTSGDEGLPPQDPTTQHLYAHAFAMVDAEQRSAALALLERRFDGSIEQFVAAVGAVSGTNGHRGSAR